MARRAESRVAARAAGATLLAAALVSCASVTGNTGASPTSQRHATVHGDLPALTAGLPVSVVLRAVDGNALGFGRASAEVAPGRHSFLVDCTVHAAGSTNRYAIEAEVFAGRDYRLSADATATRCNGVEVLER